MNNYINPVIPNMGLAEQAIAGSAEIILTSADRDFIKSRTGEVDNSRKFKELVKELLNKSTDISGIENNKEKKIEPEDIKTRIKLEKSLIKHAPGYAPQERVSISNQTPKKQENTSRENADQYGHPDEELFDEYAVIYGQRLMRIPVNEERKLQLEAEIKPNILTQIKARVEKAVSEVLSYAIKESFYKNIEDPELISKIILNSKNAKKLLDASSGRAELDLDSLMEIIKELGIPIEKLQSLYNKETVKLSADALKIEALLLKRQNEIATLEEKLKDQYIEMLLTDNPLGRYSLTVNVNITVRRLEFLKVQKERIASLIKDAKKIAWLKSVVLLKELYLKRVFSASKKEFETLSSQISSHTLRARKLGLRVSKEGVKFVEARLEKMALEAASYKLELMQSMQKVSFDKNREKDIYWLKMIIPHLQKLGNA